jgi:hypothetical protein
MKPVLKFAIVAGGYLLAFLAACGAVALHSAVTDESGAQDSGGMSAFGNLVLFVAVFGAVAWCLRAWDATFSCRRRKAPASYLNRILRWARLTWEAGVAPWLGRFT